MLPSLSGFWHPRQAALLGWRIDICMFWFKRDKRENRVDSYTSFRDRCKGHVDATIPTPNNKGKGVL